MSAEIHTDVAAVCKEALPRPMKLRTIELQFSFGRDTLIEFDSADMEAVVAIAVEALRKVVLQKTVSASTDTGIVKLTLRRARQRTKKEPNQ